MLKYLVHSLIIFLLSCSICFGGASYDFDGINDDIAYTNTLATASQYTVMCSFNPDFSDTDATNQELIVRANVSGDSARAFRIGWEGGNNNWVSDSKGAFSYTLSDTTQGFSSGQWYTIAFGYAGSSGTGQFFWNGSPVTTTQVVHVAGANNTASMKFTIGSQVSSTTYFNAQIAWCRAWNRKLTDVEIAEEYFKPCSITNGLILCTDSAFMDISSSNLSQTITGATVNSDGPPIKISGGAR